MECGGLISISYTNILSHTHNPNDGKTLTKPSFPFPNPCNALDNIQTPPVGSFRVGNFVNQAFSSSSFYLFFILILTINLDLLKYHKFCCRFFNTEDIKLEECLEPEIFLKRYPSVQVVKHHNKLIRYYSREPLMLTGIGKDIWHSAVELVFINNLRGHDIAKALVQDNLVVSASTGTFALKEPISDMYDGSKPFKGYDSGLGAIFWVFFLVPPPRRSPSSQASQSA